MIRTGLIIPLLSILLLSACGVSATSPSTPLASAVAGLTPPPSFPSPTATHLARTTPPTPTKTPLPSTPSPAPQEDAFKLSEEQSFQDYTVRVYEKGFDEGYFEVLKNSEQVYRQDGFKFNIGHVYEEFREITPIGQDITGNSVPDLVISEWTGGAHCCLVFYVFEWGETFRKVGTIDAGHGDLSHFEDLDGDANLEFTTNDWTFAYWRTSFADSPAPRVILHFQDDGYHLASDLMVQPAPSAKEIQKQIEQIQAEPSWQEGQPSVSLWAYMLELIYTGHAKLAPQFFEEVWPAQVAGKEEFLADFQAQLSQSPYWSDLQRLDH